MKITDLHKKIGRFELNVESLSIEPGRIHGIVGPNGCGKTVFLKLVMGILNPDRGYIDYEGILPQEITMMAQRPYLMRTSVYKNLIYPLKIRGICPDEGRMDELLDRAGLLEQKKQYARSLSSGEKQKLSFLRAMVFEPKVIIMDETLSNLDAESEELFKELISMRQKKDPATWLIVNHQWDHVNRLFESVHYMEKGRFIKNEIAEG